MILGDVKSPSSLLAIQSMVNHSQKIVRVEAVRSLCKIGTPDIAPLFRSLLHQFSDPETKQLALDFLVLKKYREAVETLVHLAKDPAATGPWRKSLLTAIGHLGGPKAKEFLESTQKEKGFLGRFNADGREEATLIKNLLEKMAA
jgi:HEAT repeat protein